MKSGIWGMPFTQDHTWWRTACGVALLCVATAIASPAQTFTTLVNFNEANGSGPYFVSLDQGTGGNFYGTTVEGGTDSSEGTVFNVTPTVTMTTLYHRAERRHHRYSQGGNARPHAFEQRELPRNDVGAGPVPAPVALLYP